MTHEMNVCTLNMTFSGTDDSGWLRENSKEGREVLTGYDSLEWESTELRSTRTIYLENVLIAQTVHHAHFTKTFAIWLNHCEITFGYEQGGFGDLSILVWERHFCFKKGDWLKSKTHSNVSMGHTKTKVSLLILFSVWSSIDGKR